MVDNSLITDGPLFWKVDGIHDGFESSEPEVLSAEQNKECFNLKLRTRNQDIRYLDNHPEVHAISSMLVHKLLSERPDIPLQKYCQNLFSRPRREIENDLRPFLRKHGRDKNGNTSDHALHTSALKGDINEEVPQMITLFDGDVQEQMLLIPKDEKKEPTIEEEHAVDDSFTSFAFTTSVEEMLAEIRLTMHSIETKFTAVQEVYLTDSEDEKSLYKSKIKLVQRPSAKIFMPMPSIPNFK